MTALRALTVLQPWAGAIAHFGKDVENRSWNTRYRGPVAIHAGRRYDRSVFDRQEGIDRLLTPRGRYGGIRGAIIAVADLVDVHCCDGHCSPWADPGQWHFVLADVRPTAPIPARGALGLWRVPADLARLISTTAPVEA